MELHSSLEGALKAYFDAESLRTLGQKNQESSRTAGHPTSMTDATTPTKPSIRYIRSITIVMGRGFYSFSLGPPAPFLRVEYYNPKMRWIVKALLEQGLDVPRPLHPDPCQYEQVDSQKLDGRLIFHCFEAHIPYTMQVFKDLNLSGMSPVLVRDCRFRTPLPRKRRVRVVTSSREDDILNNQSASSSNHLFLKGNVNDSFIWQSVCNRESSSKMDEFWTRKETSCDIEADTTVKNISNVQYILRPDDDDANDDTIHWRAVPSLREIWEEEKRRMEYLCSRTKQDCKDVFQFDAPTTKSGTRLAATGARRLFDSTPEIRGHYIKALTDIVLFHEKEVAEEDQRFQSIATKSDLETENSRVYAIDQDEDVLNTLRALAAQFSPAAGTESRSDIDHLLSRCLSSQERSTPRISSRKKSDKSSLDLHKLANDIEFGMNVDRCDVVEDFLSQGPPSNDVVLNPLTLTMERMNYDEDEESFEDEEDFERSLSATEKDLHPMTNHDSDLRHFHQSIFLELDEDKNMKNTVGATPSAFARNHKLPFPLEQSDYSPSIKKPSSTKEVDHSFSTGLFYEQCIKAPNRSEVSKNLPGFSTSFTNYTAFQFSNDVINKMGWDSSFLTGDNYQTLSYYEPTTGPPSSISVRRYLLQNPLYPKKRELNSKHISNTSEVTVQNSQEKDENICSYVAIEEVADADESCHILADDYTIGSPSLYQIQANGQAKSTRYYRKKNITMTKFSNTSAQCPKSGDVPSSASNGTGFDLKAASSSKALMSGGLSLMSIEIHVQCRTGKSSLNKAKEIAMTPDPTQDPIFAIAYIYSLDPGNGERIQVLDQGCVFIPITRQVDSSQVPLCHQPDGVKEKNLLETLGISSKLNLEVATDERHLLLRFSSIIQLKDPDVLFSWDTQCAGIGYIISRGEELRKMDIANNQSQLDMIRLLGRTPRSRHSCDCNMNDFAAEESEKNKITGSGLGTEWDDLVGAGGLASSIVRSNLSIFFTIHFRLIPDGWF
jgi:hypothetical protein